MTEGVGGIGNMAGGALNEVLTLGEAASFVRVSQKTLGEMARAGRIPCQRVGREWRFLRSAVEEWLANEHPAGESRRIPSLQQRPTQRTLPFAEVEGRAGAPPTRGNGFGDTAFTINQQEPIHRWVPWIAGFSASFVASVLDRAKETRGRKVVVLDPFAGVGTTLVESVRRGFTAVGFEINPYAAMVARTKVECWRYDVKQLRRTVSEFVHYMDVHGKEQPRSRPPTGFLSRSPFFGSAVQRKVLHVLDFIRDQDLPWVQNVLRMSLGAVLVSVSNYSYEPSLSRRSAAGKADIADADVADAMARKLRDICSDISALQDDVARLGSRPKGEIFQKSFLTDWSAVPKGSVDFLITSPPYLNNYHYIRNTRPHLFWLDLVARRSELKALEQANFGKFWQTVRAGPPVSLSFMHDEIEQKLDLLRRRNPDRGVYGGRGWANYAASYFNDCWVLCRAARALLKPGATMVVVIGNNILQGIEFETDRYLAEIAERCGFEVCGVHEVRKKRTGSSIINSSVRSAGSKKSVELHESAVELRLLPDSGRRRGED